MRSEPAWPEGDVLTTWDDATRTVTDHTEDPPTMRPYTAEENADADRRGREQTAEANRATLTQRATAALAGNRDFLALTAPTNAQTLAQVKALTRQVNGLARLIAGDLTGTD